MHPNTPPIRPAAANPMSDITLHLSIDELNLVLEGIGNLPFARVFALVGKIQTQAGAQLQTQAQTQAQPAPNAGQAG